MKKFLVIMLSLIIVLLFGCGEKKKDDLKFSQAIIIADLSTSSPKYKSSNSISTINQVTDILNEIEKSSVDNDEVKSDFIVEISIDGETFKYSIGETFIDADGHKYKIENYQEIIEKISKIYVNIDDNEKEYK